MVAGIATRRFTVDEFHRMVEAGILQEDDRLELVRGQILEMAPIGSRHAFAVDRLTRSLVLLLQELPVVVRVQNPIRLEDETELYPDIAVVKDRGSYYWDNTPGPSDVNLVVEVADSTVSYDRRTKGPLYAGARIPEYWLINLKATAISVHRAPGAEGYGDIALIRRGQVLSPLFAPDLKIPVDRFLS